MAQAAAQKPWLGYGYSTGFRSVVAGLIQAHSPYGYVPNAQDGYLDVMLNLGIAGLALALWALALAASRAVRIASQPQAGVFAFAPLLIMALIVEMNGVGSGADQRQRHLRADLRHCGDRFRRNADG